MATATKAAPRKPATKKSPAARAATVRSGRTSASRIRGNSDANDAILRAAEDAREDGLRAVIDSTAPKVASAKDVRLLARDLTDAFLHCRDFGHIWRQAGAQKVGRAYERQLFCPSCKQNKFQVLNSHGEIVTEKRDYPEGYLIKGMGRVDGDGKSILRLASVIREVEKSESKAAKAS